MDDESNNITSNTRDIIVKINKKKHVSVIDICVTISLILLGTFEVIVKYITDDTDIYVDERTKYWLGMCDPIITYLLSIIKSIQLGMEIKAAHVNNGTGQYENIIIPENNVETNVLETYYEPMSSLKESHVVETNICSISKTYDNSYTPNHSITKLIPCNVSSPQSFTTPKNEHHKDFILPRRKSVNDMETVKPENVNKTKESFLKIIQNYMDKNKDLSVQTDESCNVDESSL